MSSSGHRLPASTSCRPSCAVYSSSRGRIYRRISRRKSSIVAVSMTALCQSRWFFLRRPGNVDYLSSVADSPLCSSGPLQAGSFHRLRLFCRRALRLRVPPPRLRIFPVRLRVSWQTSRFSLSMSQRQFLFGIKMNTVRNFLRAPPAPPFYRLDKTNDTTTSKSYLYSAYMKKYNHESDADRPTDTRSLIERFLPF